MSKFQGDISKYIEGLAEHSSDVFWIKNTSFTKQIYISPAYETIWGRSCESMYADPKSWSDYVYPEDLERLFQTVEHCRQNMSRDTSYTEVYRIKRPDGRTFWLKERGFAIYDSFDHLIGFGGVAQDITEQKRNERVEAQMQVLSETRDNYEEHLQSIIDSIAGNHWWKDKDGVYRGYNRTLLKSLGYKSPDEIIGKTDYELPWADQADHLVAHDREVIRRGVAIEREELVQSTTGEERIYLVNKAPLRNPSGEVIGTIGHGIDITEMRKVKRELERAKEELEREKDSIEGRLKGALSIVVGNHWMKDLDGRYLGCNDSLARIFGLEGGVDLVGKTDYELPWIDDAASMLAYDKEVIDKGAPITREQTIKTADGRQRYYIVTKAPLRDSNQKIVGTIGNSTDITEQKERQKALALAKQQAEEQLDKVMQGVGIEDPENMTSMVACRVLVVEDNLINQKVARILLSDLGCEVDIAQNGREALEKAAHSQYDIIFMDIGLPEMDGVTVAKRLRENVKTRDAIIVALTAHSLEQDVQRCHNVKMNAVLTKPVCSKDLEKILLSLCPHKARDFSPINM